MRVVRAILIFLILAVIGLPIISYVMFSTDWAQDRLRAAGEEALERLLGTDAKVGSVSYVPFNRLRLNDISVADDNGAECASVKSILVRAELMELLLRQRIIIDYVVVDGLEANVYKETPDSPLNIAGIIQRLKKDKPKKEPAKFNLSINSIELLHAALHYNVLSADTIPGRFDPSHINISDLALSVDVPKISSEGYELNIRKLAFCESSGLCLSGLAARVALSPEEVSVTDFSIEMPSSRIEFADMHSLLEGYSSLGRLGIEMPVEIGIYPTSYVSLADLKALLPQFANFDFPINIGLEAEGVLKDLNIKDFTAYVSNGAIRVGLNGKCFGLPNISEVKAQNLKVDAYASGQSLIANLGLMNVKLPSSVVTMLDNARSIDIKSTLDGTLASGKVAATVQTDCGDANIDGSYQKNGQVVDFDGVTSINSMNLGRLMSNPLLGMADAIIETDGRLQGKNVTGNIKCEINDFGYKDYEYHDIKITGTLTDKDGTVYVSANDPNLQMLLQSQMKRADEGKIVGSLVLQLVRADLDALNLWHKYPGNSLKATVLSEFSGKSPMDFEGYLNFSNIQYLDSLSKGLKIRKLNISAENNDRHGHIGVESDFLNGDVQGRINPLTVGNAMSDIMAHVFPNFEAPKSRATHESDIKNNFVFDFVADNAGPICEFFELPVSVLDPLNIRGGLNEEKGLANVILDAEWFLQGDKLVKDTNVSVALDGPKGDALAYLTTHYPTKKGPMNLVADIRGKNGRYDTKIDWDIERDIPINGSINFITDVWRSEEGKMGLEVNFAPGKINFGNEVWNILPSTIKYSNKFLQVDGFALDAPTQKVRIEGTAGESEEDVLTVDLENIQLIEIFETLEIDKALLCGNATGQITVRDLFGKTPNIRSHDFFVKGIGYNRCVLGDADIKLWLDNETMAFVFDAVVTQEDGRHSTIQGSITPATEELDLQFDADHVRIGFMQPFMEAFCSQIDGYATGKAHLFGTFKYIDLTSTDLVADTLRMKVDFTNTWYSTGHTPLNITPGNISFSDVTIYDDNGHKAKLEGYVKHEFFKKPVFKFSVRDAQDFLCYDMPKGVNSRWWGRIYGNGRADIDGKPGEVNIGVNMTTCPHSVFTFALTDELEAVEYSFIAFNDVTPHVEAEAFYERAVESNSVKKAESLRKNEDDESPTAYNMDIQVAATEDAEVILVMDPIGGDEIKAHGSGNIRMYYGSASDILTLNGDYVLTSGKYNFTLQDIIIKEFTIRSGSSIKFSGDPYAATLDINAIYQTNGNLSDLDESFLSDKDLNRTNIPVYAVMYVTGSMLQPDIKFDLEFPTITSDVVSRKVHSIVSTEEMMNRQIIYLLALNRFYTPEYMNSTTKGNELFSVASSTISSQLSSMLGKLSDNWSIAPNLRSNRGDFSDVEVDVNLSSRLLNNRLLFNGNFGYRDKSLNTNQFIGDFDLEYLLNRSGTLRLKAYNRYNDQNFYVRTAQTTQGVGVMLRKDFDNILDLFRRKKKAPAAEPIPLDSVPALVLPEELFLLETLPADTVPAPAEDFIQFRTR